MKSCSAARIRVVASGYTYTYRVDQNGRRALFLVPLLQPRKERVVRPDMVSVGLSKIV